MVVEGVAVVIVVVTVVVEALVPLHFPLMNEAIKSHNRSLVKLNRKLPLAA